MGVNASVSSCFGKIRTVASANNGFRARLDAAAKSSRIDSIVKVLMEKANQVCTQEENDFLVDYFDGHQEAITMTESIVKNLTNEEKDRLNTWSNLNDTTSEANFFLKKFQALPMKTQDMLRQSFNNILNTFVGSSLPPALSKAVAHFDEDDVDQLHMYAKENQSSELSYYIASKIKDADLPPADMNGVYRFLYQIFRQ